MIFFFFNIIALTHKRDKYLKLRVIYSCFRKVRDSLQSPPGPTSSSRRVRRRGVVPEEASPRL